MPGIISGVAAEASSELVLDLAQGLREVVLPELGSHAGRAEAGAGAGGDVTFAVDAAAERYAGGVPGRAGAADGLLLRGPGPGRAPRRDHVLVVDPIDGTRPAMAGLESACVAVALAPLGDGEPTMADVEVGCVVEIKSGDWFLAVRGAGVSLLAPVALSPAAEVRPDVLGLRVPGPPGARRPSRCSAT